MPNYRYKREQETLKEYITDITAHEPLITLLFVDMFAEILHEDPGYHLERIRWKDAGSHKGIHYHRLQIFGDPKDWSKEDTIDDIISKYHKKIAPIMNEHYASDNQVFY